MAIRKHAVVLGVMLLMAGPVCAQTGTQAGPPPQKPPAEEQLQNESDPTKSVFLSVRNEYFNLRNDAWSNALIIRSDRVLLKKHSRLGGRLGILTRFDLPIITSHVGGVTHAGLGDLYAQALYVPWLTRHFAIAMGSGMTFPTATHQTLGRGKWQVAPALAPIWFFPRGKGFFFIKLQNFVSFAGNGNRADVNFLSTQPVFLYRFHRRRWVLIDTETKTDWERNNRRSYRSGFEIGHVVTSRFALSIKPEFPWGKHREGDWTLKLLLTWYRRRG